MREIIFRGKSVNDGRWVFGNLSDYGDCKTITTVKDCSIIDSCEVIPETVGQYIGLSDKNGRNIFDGDVVRVYYPFDDPEDCVVSWSKEGARWDFGGCDAYFCTPSKNCEIIGNIFDNPELLEGKK